MKHRLSISRLELLLCRLDSLIDELNAQGAEGLGGEVTSHFEPKSDQTSRQPLDCLAALQKAERLSRERVALQALLSAEKELHNLPGKEQLKEAVTRQLGILQSILEAHDPRSPGTQAGHATGQVSKACLTQDQVQSLQADVARLKLELVGLYDALVWIKASTLEIAISSEVEPLVDEVMGKSRGTCTRYRCPQATQCA